MSHKPADAKKQEEQQPPWDGNKVEMGSEKLGNNVYAFIPKDAAEVQAKGGAVATSSGIFVGERGVLLVESMLNKRLNHQVQELVKKIANKPIRYCVNTSSHGDHSYGNMYLPKETIIIQHQHTRDYIAGHLADDKAFMTGAFGTGRGIEEIQARPADILIQTGGRIKVDLGAGKVVEIIDFGFAQTGGDLWVWDPESKVIFTGNPLLAKPAIPWLLDGHMLETLESCQKAYDFLPADAKVVPGHGLVTDKEGLKFTIGYLADLKKHVEAAIAANLSQEDAVKRVAEEMKSYGAYQLYGWVHTNVNVPKTYQELKELKKPASAKK